MSIQRFFLLLLGQPMYITSCLEFWRWLNFARPHNKKHSLQNSSELKTNGATSSKNFSTVNSSWSDLLGSTIIIWLLCLLIPSFKMLNAETGFAGYSRYFFVARLFFENIFHKIYNISGLVNCFFNFCTQSYSTAVVSNSRMRTIDYQ